MCWLFIVDCGANVDDSFMRSKGSFKKSKNRLYDIATGEEVAKVFNGRHVWLIILGSDRSAQSIKVVYEG